MLANAEEASPVYNIDRISPEASWRDRVMPSKNPTFHRNEIDEGVGRSSSDFFSIFRIGFFFVSWVFIRRRWILIGWGCVFGWLVLLLLGSVPPLL